MLHGTRIAANNLDVLRVPLHIYLDLEKVGMVEIEIFDGNFL